MLGYIDPATGSIIIGAVAAGGAGVAAAASSSKARLKSIFRRGKGEDPSVDEGLDADEHEEDSDTRVDVTDTDPSTGTSRQSADAR